MPLLRKIIFYIFVAVYCVLCPLLVLRLMGFMYDPNARHWFKTGMIYVSSNPPQATVWLNGRLIPDKTPTIIRDLSPGQYTVRMELLGHDPWENRVPVEEKKATPIENILLIPSRWSLHGLDPRPCNNIVGLAPNTLIASCGPAIKDMAILRIADQEQMEPIFPPESIYSEGQMMAWFVQSQSPFMVLKVRMGEKIKHLWLDTRDKPVHIEDISDLMQSDPDKLFWETNDEKIIYAFYAESVDRINIKAKAIYPHIDPKTIPSERKKAPAIPSLEAEQIFLINNENTFLFRKGNEIFLQDRLPGTLARTLKIQDTSPKTDIFYSEKSGRLFFIHPKDKVLTSIAVLQHKPFIPKPIADTLRLKKLEEAP